MADSYLLPPELWIEVLSWLYSWKHLYVAALVCRSWHAEAERLLYRSIDIYRLKGFLIDPLLRRLSSGSRPIASQIQKLVVFTNTDNSNIIYGILSTVHNLKWLTLLAGGNWPPSIPSSRMPFALDIFETDYRCYQSVHEFLISQPTIRLLSWTPEQLISPFSILSQKDVPNLRAICLHQISTAPEHLPFPSIRSVDIRMLAPLISGDISPQAHIRAIRISILNDKPVRELPRIFPNVTYLTTTTYFGWAAEIPFLIQFPHLRKVQFVTATTLEAGPDEAIGLPMALNDSGPSTLQTVEVVYRSGYTSEYGGGEVVVRSFQKDDLGKFSETSRCGKYYDALRLEWATWDG